MRLISRKYCGLLTAFYPHISEESNKLAIFAKNNA